MYFEINISTQREDFYDITQQVRQAVSDSTIRNGIAVVYCSHNGV